MLKPFDQFYRNRAKSIGYGSYCKPCQHAHYKKRYHFRTKVLGQKWQPFKTEYQDRNRMLIVDYLLEHPCVDCKEDDILVLEFDHVRGDKRAGLESWRMPEPPLRLSWPRLQSARFAARIVTGGGQQSS